MKHRMKKVAKMLGIICLSSASAIGCSSAPVSDNSAGQIIEMPLSADSKYAENSDTTTAPIDTDIENTVASNASADTDTDNTGGKWHVLSPEVAAVIDADFEGIVRKIEKNTFYIAESFVEIFDDGSILDSSPAADADIPDSELIPVAFDENTHFYIRTIHNDGESYEDTEATFQDITEQQSVEMKGRFENDVFHADEIRIVKTA